MFNNKEWIWNGRSNLKATERNFRKYIKYLPRPEQAQLITEIFLGMYLIIRMRILHSYIHRIRNNRTNVQICRFFNFEKMKFLIINSIMIKIKNCECDNWATSTDCKSYLRKCGICSYLYFFFTFANELYTMLSFSRCLQHFNERKKYEKHIYSNCFILWMVCFVTA